MDKESPVMGKVVGSRPTRILEDKPVAVGKCQAGLMNLERG